MRRMGKKMWPVLAIAAVLACAMPFITALLGPMSGLLGVLAVFGVMGFVRNGAAAGEREKLLNCLEQNRWQTTQQVFVRMQTLSPACTYQGVYRLLAQLYRQKKAEHLVQPDEMGESAHHWRLPSRAPEDAVPIAQE